MNYTELSAELEQVLSELQRSDLDIDEAIKLHERGTKIVKKLQKYLQDAENKITKITAANSGEEE